MGRPQARFQIAATLQTILDLHHEQAESSKREPPAPLAGRVSPRSRLERGKVGDDGLTTSEVAECQVPP